MDKFSLTPPIHIGYHAAMKLETWLSSSNKTAAEFGKELGVKSPATTYRYMRGERIPRPEIMRRIAEITEGQVTPGDFYDQDTPESQGK